MISILRTTLFGLVVVAVGLSAGCGRGSGIWFLDVSPATDFVCDQGAVVHNFTGAQEPNPGTFTDPWTYEMEDTQSHALGFAQFVDTKDGQRILILDGSAFPGTKSGGEWTFSWDAKEDYLETREHESGYEYTDRETYTQTDTIVVDFKGSTATGTWTTSMVDKQEWTESDTWDAALIGIGGGQIPAAGYLVDAAQVAVFNDSDTTNCSGNPCTLSITTSCNQNSTFEATSLKDGEAFDGLDDAGQPFGT